MTIVTFTGVDEYTKEEELIRLSNKYPNIEWGILFSNSRQGFDVKYPNLDFIKTLLKYSPINVKFSVHYCGNSVNNLLSRNQKERELLYLISDIKGRIQLNFNYKKNKIDLIRLKDLINYFSPEVKIITQHNKANNEIYKEFRHLENHHLLFDSSGGNGVSPDFWHSPILNKFCGYAGGLGLDNIAIQYNEIKKLNGNTPFWIDMETKVRKNNLFDLDTCEKIINVVNSFSEEPKGE